MTKMPEAIPDLTAGVHAAVRQFYDAYYAALDDLRLEEWPLFFTEGCSYMLVSRENHDRGLPLATVRAESRGMLEDRVNGLRKSQYFAPRYYRRFPGPLQIAGDPRGIEVRHNLLVIQVLIDRQPEIVLCGVCRDLLVLQEERLLLGERKIIFDSEMVLNSLIYPV
jgi:salicylate 5-hydroxylase small subunit